MSVKYHFLPDASFLQWDQATLYKLSTSPSQVFCCLVAKLCLTLCDPMDCSPLGSSVCGILQARILEWVAISFSSGSSPPRDGTGVFCLRRQICTLSLHRSYQGAILDRVCLYDECLSPATLVFLTYSIPRVICKSLINRYIFKPLHHPRHYCKPSIRSLDCRRAYQEWLWQSGPGVLGKGTLSPPKFSWVRTEVPSSSKGHQALWRFTSKNDCRA